MRLVDDNGKVHEVSERLTAAVRWLVTEVGPLVECRENPAKATINLYSEEEKMPLIRPDVIALIAAIATVLVQLFKGPIPEKVREWIPMVLMVLLTAGGVYLAAVYSYDLLAGGLEGFFGAASSLGFYAAASSIPGVKGVIGSNGWVADKPPESKPITDETGALLTEAYEQGLAE